MTTTKQTFSHKDTHSRLKRAHGHLAKIIQMIEDEEGCLKISQQLLAVEKAIIQAKKNIIHEHIEHCLETTNVKDKQVSNLKEFKEITKYL
jgi:DNA-binding FrmR family transcriptional regulator